MIQEFQPIVVTGIPRSGISIIAGILEKCNIYGGVVNKMYENECIRDEVIKPYLKSIRIDENGQYPISSNREKINYTALGDMRDKILKILNPSEKIWFYKDSRLLLSWEMWSLMFPKTCWVIVKRKNNDIIKSCLKTSYMNAFSNEKICKKINVNDSESGWCWWINQYQKLIDSLKLCQENIIEIEPEQLLFNINDICFLLRKNNISYDVEEIKNFVFEKLQKTIKNKGIKIWQE